jgi:hypothetical protein
MGQEIPHKSPAPAIILPNIGQLAGKVIDFESFDGTVHCIIQSRALF